MSYQETGVVFQCEGESLVGVLATPDHGLPAGDSAVVLLVGGPQYRVGSHRLFTVLMRTLASAGYPSLRFDFRGMGDSTGINRGFEEVSQDVAAAIDAVQRHGPHIRRIVLFGLCDGASAALIYLSVARDPRISGLCLLNPWVRSEAGLSRIHVKHYYARRLVQSEFWRKLRDPKAVGRALKGLASSLYQAAGPRPRKKGGRPTFQERMSSAAEAFKGNLLIVMSGDDFTAKEFAAHARTDSRWRSKANSPETSWADIAGADHTFSSSPSRDRLSATVLSWLDRTCVLQR